MEYNMKLKIIIIIIFIILFLNIDIISAEENEYGIVKAWFNEQNATVETVEGIKLRVGEPVEVKVEVILKIDGDVSFKLYEPGVTRAYKIINGPSDIENWIDNLNMESGWSKTYTWTVTPNGAWKNGNAPLNIFVQFNKGMNNKKIQFTIANPYILDEQYTGAAATTPAPEITGTGAQAKETPFPPVIFVFMALLVAWRLRTRA
ncbi:MAG: sarcinarray family MAST domain-containing protein [Candidatus Methanoperedens sp.]|nr:MAG: sarcinarray family MAST domain-containing protein [Candidatus Methanoperedens sp.]